MSVKLACVCQRYPEQGCLIRSNTGPWLCIGLKFTNSHNCLCRATQRWVFMGTCKSQWLAEEPGQMPCKSQQCIVWTRASSMLIFDSSHVTRWVSHRDEMKIRHTSYRVPMKRHLSMCNLEKNNSSFTYLNKVVLTFAMKVCLALLQSQPRSAVLKLFLACPPSEVKKVHIPTPH